MTSTWTTTTWTAVARTLFDGQPGSPGRARSVLMRTPPKFTVHPATSPTTVYYLSPHERNPTGGVRVIYRHVDLLNEIGIPAAVLHQPSGFRVTWFQNQTRVTSAREIHFEANDIIVVPEFYGPGLHRIPAEARVMVFNQGGYHTFDGLDFQRTTPGAPYSELEQLIGIITVSDDSRDLLRHAFPGIPISLCRPVVDETLFHPGSTPARRQMAFTTTRRAGEREQLLHILRARGVDWRLAPISGLSEAAVAATLRESAIFLSFSDRDGFGLPPAEAMASGCYVIGYPGGGGLEFFDPSYSRPINSLQEFAVAVEQASTLPIEGLASYGSLASSAILGRYNADGLRDDLEALYRPLLLPSAIA